MNVKHAKCEFHKVAISLIEKIVIRIVWRSPQGKQILEKAINVTLIPVTKHGVNSAKSL